MQNFIPFSNFPFLQLYFLGNTLYEWLVGFVIFFVCLIGLKLFRSIVIIKLKKISEKTKTEIDDIIINAINAIYWPFYVFVAIYFALSFINTSAFIEKWSYYVFIVVVTYYAIRFLGELIDYSGKMIIKRRGDGEQDAGIVKLLTTTAKVVLWAGALVLILANIGYNVTSLIAGLGIGGIAIALALQNILGDLFNSLAIYFDKPFKIGDFIIVGDHMGTVKKVGVKTTRIQALQGEEIVISNSELTSSRVQNFGLMRERRIVFKVGVTYDTPYEKLNRIPEMIKRVIEKQKETRVDRVHFKEFGDSSLMYEVVYYVLSGDYTKYMDIQQAINLAIVEKFEKEKIVIAYPTQTIYIEK